MTRVLACVCKHNIYYYTYTIYTYNVYRYLPIVYINYKPIVDGEALFLPVTRCNPIHQNIDMSTHYYNAYTCTYIF